MDNNVNKEIEAEQPNINSDSLVFTEGVREFVDIIGDENIDSHGNTPSDTH
ncbi:hypothetical protein [Paenibacillus puerhi]|uniref:hypothetical protein n=1 Tax=Paenibacillus puerhi TaxID=2692622 RepID=UPI00135884B1|nr:hypothetical protein [Paenibacillus puerhi]